MSTILCYTKFAVALQCKHPVLLKKYAPKYNARLLCIADN